MTTPTLPPYDELPHVPSFPFESIPLANTTYPETAVDGLSVRHVSPYCTVAIEPWPNISINDYYAVRIQDLNNPAASDIVRALGERYNLVISEDKMPEGEVAIFSRVVRAGSLQESRSATRIILIKTTLPGGFDRRVWEPWHSQLSMAVEGVPEGSVINPDVAAAGLTCLITPYENIRKNDVITVVIDGIYVEHVVSPAEAASARPIPVLLAPSVLAKITKFGPVGVVFSVHDVVKNVSGGKYRYSKPLMFTSELDRSLLPFPLFLVDGDVSSQVDLDTQSTSDFAVAVQLPYKSPAPKPRNQVVVVLDITEADGSTRTVRLPAVIDRNQRGETVVVPNDLITSLAGGWFRVSFESLSASGVLLGKSASFTVMVVGTPVLMPAVTVSPAEAGLIPLNTDVVVTLPNYEPHDANWLETLVLQQVVPGGGGERYTQLQTAGPQGGTRRVTRQTLEAFANRGPFEIYYMTDDGNGTASSRRESTRLVVQVGDRVEDLPEPFVRGAIGDNIDPADVQDAEMLMMFPYDGSRTGDKLEWSVIGKDPAGSANGTITITGATAGEVLPTVFFPAPLSVLTRNIGGSIDVSYSIVRTGPPAAVLRSKVLRLTVGQLVTLERPRVLEADALQQQLNPGAVFQGATVRIAYTPMRNDQIFVKWRGAYGFSEIELQVTGNPQAGFVDAIVPPDVIAKAIRSNGNVVTIEYSFTRGQFTYRSEVLSLQLLPLAGLTAPTIEGIGDNPVLLLTSLADTARTLVPAWPLIHKDQRMWLSYAGTFNDDTAFIENTYTANLVTASGVTKGISPPAPTDKLQRLKNGSRLTIRFWVSFAQSTDKSTAVEFGVREYLVQTIPATLPAPAFANRVGPTQSIYPLDYENTASVRVAYTGMNTTQSIEPQWIFPDGSSVRIPARYGANSGYVDFPISQQILANSVGKTISLRYVATINGTPVDSAIQTLTVQTIRATDLPRPLINGAADKSTLDLNTFTGNGLATLNRWRLIQPGQMVWMRCSSEHVADLVLLDGVPITAAQAQNGLVNIPVLRAWLRRVKTRRITITCRVNFDGSVDETTAVPFQSTTYDIRWELGIIESITVGSQPHWAAITRDGKTAYLTNHGSHTVSVIDIGQRKVINNIGGFNQPFRIALHPDESRLYVGNLGTSTISVINTSNNTLIQTIPSLKYIWALCLNKAGTRLFVSGSIDNSVAVYDAMTGALVSTTKVNNPFGCAINHLETRFYVSGPAQVSLMNPSGAAGLIGAIAGINTQPVGSDIAFNPFDLPKERAYVTGTNAVYIIDPPSNTIARTLEGFLNAYGVAMNTRIRECYVSSRGTSFTVINTDTESVVRTLTGFANPAGIAVTPDGFLALVANQANGTLSFIAV